MNALPILLALGLAASGSETTLTVLAAASLKGPLEQASGEFERAHPGVKVQLSAAATGVLAQQVEHGAPADVFIGAAREQAEALAKKGLLSEAQVVARNRLVVGVPAGARARPASLADLERPEFARIGLGQPKSVPAGKYAIQALAKAGLDTKLERRFVYGESVTQVLTYLRGGNVEAGFVYQSDVQSAGQQVQVAFTVDEAMHDPIVYPAAVLTRSTHADLARAYLAYLVSASGQAHLLKAGFLAPAPAAGLEVAGALPKVGSLSVAELEALGPVTAKWSEHGTEHEVVGVPVEKVLARFGFEPGPMGKDVPKAEKRAGWKKVVVASARDGFQAVFSCAELSASMGPTQALVAWRLDGKPLPEGQGPLRLVVPTDKEPSRSLYALSRIDLVDMRKVVPPP